MIHSPEMSANESIHRRSVERALGNLWMEVLQIPQRPAVTDDFFGLGGDSMAMVILEYRIKEVFSVELPPGVILTAPTLQELSSAIEAARTPCSGTQPSTPLEP